MGDFFGAPRGIAWYVRPMPRRPGLGGSDDCFTRRGFDRDAAIPYAQRCVGANDYSLGPCARPVCDGGETKCAFGVSDQPKWHRPRPCAPAAPVALPRTFATGDLGAAPATGFDKCRLNM
jgi:hypothetical protein